MFWQKPKSPDEMFVDKQKKTLTKVLRAQKQYCDSTYSNRDCPPQDKFLMSEADIRKVVHVFINDAVKDEELKNKLLTTLDGKNPNVKIKLISDPKDPLYDTTDPKKPLYHKLGVTGKVDPNMVDNKIFFNNDIDTTTALLVLIGEKQSSGEILTDMQRISTFIHELTHSISEKHNNSRFIVPKDHSVGEIEAMFMEKLFFDWTNKNAEKLANTLQDAGYSKVTQKWLEECASKSKKSKDFGLIKNIEDFLDKNKIDKHNGKPYQYRYIVGNIYSDVLLDEYNADPAKTMHYFNKFLMINSHLNLDESATALTFGRLNSYKDVIEARNQIIQQYQA
jgi:hypothetical protein